MALHSSRQWIPLQKQLVPKVKEPITAYQKNIERRHKETIDSALKRGYLKCLDKELILQAQIETEDSEAATELQSVRRISLNGCHVQVLDEFALISCMKLRICNLGSCFLGDISALYGSVNLIKLDVSNNQISQLPKVDFWSSLASLRILYLHGNELCGREALSRLNACRVLHVLTLYDTPLALIKNYRHHAVNSILSLRALDNYVISDEEIIENLRLSGPYRPLTKQFKLQLYTSIPKGESCAKETQELYHLLLAVDKVLARYSPVIILQRHIRGWLVRKALAKSSNPKIRSLVSKASSVHSLKHAQVSKPIKISNQKGSWVISTEIQIGKQPRAPAAPSTETTKYRSLPPPPPSSPRHHVTPQIVERHVIDTKSSRAKYFMHINLRKLQQTVSDAELLEPEGVNKNFTTAFKKKSKKTDGPAAVEDVHDQEMKSCKGDDQNESDPAEASDETGVVKISGSPVKILAHDQRPDLADFKKREGMEIREAEKEILKMVTKEKEPLGLQSKPKISAKDALLFTRAAATMTLSTLQSVDQKHLAAKKSDSLKQKASVVAKIRKERVARRAKIETFKRNICDQVRDWKIEEDHRLEEQRGKQREKRVSELLRRSEDFDISAEKRLKQIQSQKHAFEFGVQNTMVGSTLDREDYKALKESEASEKRDVVREAREQAQEKQEMVRRYMDLRKEKLLREGEEARKKLDSKMLEAASNRLMASKRKIDREIARKQAAREAIAMAKDELRRGPQRPGESLPSSLGPPVVTDGESVFSPRQIINTEYKSPSHIRHLSREAHSTWQRGSRVISSQEPGHFPLIHSTSDTPLMYGMLQPGAQRTSRVELPVITSETSSSVTSSSMVISKQMSVR